MQFFTCSTDGDGTLLDHSVVLYGSPMGNSNAHDHLSLPVFIAGGGVGKDEGNRHITNPTGTPMANLFMAMAEKEGIHLESFGDSTGMMEV